MGRLGRAVLVAGLGLWLWARMAGAADLAYAPAPADNPLKGFVPYAGPENPFPHSLEFKYLPLRDLMQGEREFDWGPLERLLDAVAYRGNQTVFRVYLEYPRKPTGIPQFLIDAGVPTHTYTNSNTQPLPPALVTTPDYNHPRLRGALTNFIHALGQRYDGDPRLGFITAGLLGTWGEWHTHPRTDLWAGRETQRAVLDAYAAAFRQTPVLLRYPAGPNDPGYVSTVGRPFGFHDDSFAWATRHTGRKDDAWFFETRLKAMGPDGLLRWRTHPIGGEVRPEVWYCLWDEPSCAPAGQEFLPCVEATHVSWLMNTGVFTPKLTGIRRDRAIAAARRLGYEWWVQRARLSTEAGRFSVSCTITNTGVAPFYYRWPVEIGLARDGARVTWWRTDWDVRRLVPGEGSLELSFSADTGGIELAGTRVLLRVVNPLPNGHPPRFANQTQDADLPGWLTLGTLAP